MMAERHDGAAPFFIEDNIARPERLLEEHVDCFACALNLVWVGGRVAREMAESVVAEVPERFPPALDDIVADG